MEQIKEKLEPMQKKKYQIAFQRRWCAMVVRFLGAFGDTGEKMFKKKG